MTRAQTATNIIMYVGIIFAALILVLWYAQSVRPTRAVIGSVTADMDKLNQHYRNACGVTIYNATYTLATTVANTAGNLSTNRTHFCVIVPGTYGSCKAAPCALEDAVLPISKLPLRIGIYKGYGTKIMTIKAD